MDEAQFARAPARQSSARAAWDARLRRIKRIAEAVERDPDPHRTQQQNRRR